MTAPAVTIDVGNSSIGIGRWSGDRVTVTRAEGPEQAASLLGEVQLPGAVAISVNPRRLRALLAALGPRWAGGVRLLRDPPAGLADAPLAATAGADRLACACALLPGPGVAVDAGTAVTVDVVDATGRYLGGFIAAGPATAARGLAEAAAQLPRVDGEPRPIVPGGETHAALSAGVWGMAVGGTDRLVDSALAALGGVQARLVATGGWGDRWARDSRHADIEVDGELVHRGMARWAAMSPAR